LDAFYIFGQVTTVNKIIKEPRAYPYGGHLKIRALLLSSEACESNMPLITKGSIIVVDDT